MLITESLTVFVIKLNEGQNFDKIITSIIIIKIILKFKKPNKIPKRRATRSERF